jgi:hypothetical protein
MNPEGGDVWLVDLGLAATTPPVAIVSHNNNDPALPRTFKI